MFKLVGNNGYAVVCDHCGKRLDARSFETRIRVYRPEDGYNREIWGIGDLCDECMEKLVDTLRENVNAFTNRDKETTK